MDQNVFFEIFLVIEGTTEKVLQFIMPLKSIYNKNFGFIEQKKCFLTIQRGSKNKKSINRNYFSHEMFFSGDLSELPHISLCYVMYL